jgi:calpain-15
LLSTYEEKDDSGQVVRLVKIRNPWGFKEWGGDWSDKSDKWSKASAMKFKVGYEDKDDGIFFMTFQDYI